MTIDQLKSHNAVKIRELHPEAQPIFNKWINDCAKLGVYIYINSGYRSIQEQAVLKRQKGKDAASPGKSPHNYGLAVDIQFVINNIRTSVYGGTESIRNHLNISVKTAQANNITWGGLFSNGAREKHHFDVVRVPIASRVTYMSICLNNFNSRKMLTEGSKHIVLPKGLTETQASDVDMSQLIAINTNTNIRSTGSLDTNDVSGIEYFQFEDEFIEQGIKVFNSYQTQVNNARFATGSKDSGMLGFIPITLNLTLEGISGLKLYNKLRINQEVLPPQYPESFDFIVTKVNHKIENQDWITQISTLSTSNIERYDWDFNGDKRMSSIPSGNYKFNGSSQGGLVLGGSYPETLFKPSNSSLAQQARKTSEIFLGKAMSDDEWKIFIAGIYAESGRGELEDAHIAGVILNRAREGYSGAKNVRDVLYTKKQFESVMKGSPRFISGPSGGADESIYRNLINNLPKVDKSHNSFISNIREAYGKDEANRQRGDRLIKQAKNKGGKVIGKSIFGKNIV